MRRYVVLLPMKAAIPAYGQGSKRLTDPDGCPGGCAFALPGRCAPVMFLLSTMSKA